MSAVRGKIYVATADLGSAGGWEFFVLRAKPSGRLRVEHEMEVEVRCESGGKALFAATIIRFHAPIGRESITRFS